MSRSMKVFTVVTGATVAIAIAGAASALPGTNTVDSGDIVNGEVRRADIGGSAVNSAKIGDGTIQLADLGANSVNGSRIVDGSLTGADLAADSVNGAKVAPNSITGADIQESSLNLNDTTCSLENVHSFARVKGSASMPSTYTSSSSFVDIAHNCSGGTVQVKRQTVGVYHVRFVGDPALLAAVTPMYDGGPADDNVASLTTRGQLAASEGGFRVVIRNSGDGAQDDGWFNVMTY